MVTKKVKRPNQTSFRLDGETKRRLSEYCIKRGLKKAYVVEQAIQKYLAMQEG